MIKKETLTGVFNNIIPATFQESITYYEQLKAMQEKINELVDAYNAIAESGGSGYVLPIATADKLGGIKVGENLNISENGVLNAEATPYELPIATTTTLGGVKDSREEGVSIAGDGTIFLKAIPENFELKPREGGIYGNWLWLKPATANTLGGVKIGENLNISEDGVLSAEASSTYELPTATSNTLGGVKIGANINIVDGVISVDLPSSYTLPIATDSILGGIKIGSNLTITEDGVLNAPAPTPTYNLPIATVDSLGGVKIGQGINIDENGVISVNIQLGQGLKLVDGKITLDLGENLYFTEDGKLNAAASEPVVMTTAVQDTITTKTTQSNNNNTITETITVDDAVEFIKY